MKVSELLRSLADRIGQLEGNIPAGEHAMTPVQVDHTDHTEDSVFIPPLQQKQELLKKAAGVESFYDDPASTEQDPLDVLKQNAGLSMIIQDIGGEENDIVG